MRHHLPARLAVSSLVGLLAIQAASAPLRHPRGAAQSAGALSGVMEFRSGHAPHRTAQPARGGGGEGPGPRYTVLMGGSAASGQFTLTPRKPWLSGKGFLQADNVSIDTAMTNVIAFNGGSGDVNLVVVASAGQNYLIDEQVQGSKPGCRFTVSGPDGQSFGFPCAGSAYGVTHLTFAYLSSATNNAWFTTTVSGGADAVFQSATVGPLK